MTNKEQALIISAKTTLKVHIKELENISSGAKDIKFLSLTIQHLNEARRELDAIEIK